MTQKSRLYYILSFVFFILPPFIWGLVMIYTENNYDTVHITSLIINIIIYAVLAGIIGLLIYVKKMHIPSDEEIKYLLFGFIGNIVIYFYTFQNDMNIDNIVTIYLVLMAILVVYYLLISRKISPVELWIMVPVFLVIDTLHILYTGCGFNDSYTCYNATQGDVFLNILYFIIFLLPVGYYIHKVIELKPRDFFKYINIGLVVLLSILIQVEQHLDEKILSTISIALAFFTVLDLIVHLVNKNFRAKYVIYYIRMYTILFVMILIGTEERIFYGEATRNMLIIMVAITYTSLFINILQYVLKIDTNKEKLLDSLTFTVCTIEDKEEILKEYGQVAYDHISLEKGNYSLVAKDDNLIVGFISTYKKPLTKPLSEFSEAYINIIEVHKNYQRQKIGSSLVIKTEDYFKTKNVKQIRAWSSEDKEEAIKMWYKLNYTLAATSLYIKEKSLEVPGYFVTKKL